MSHLNIYLDPVMLKKIERAAKLEKISLSRWVKLKLEKALCHEWPKGYFDLFGVLRHEKFERPPQPDLSLDVRRAKL
ncbi:MAG: toxin-antitoxin system, antitoxin component [Chlamydiae bacterium]|nr:toxin-antitoxin system, antitoxin component [Chlamydiota bacterium]MBI3266528.1 toxin-antitoxin system, antitoxin component [Chlamydiota bacterium]